MYRVAGVCQFCSYLVVGWDGAVLQEIRIIVSIMQEFSFPLGAKRIRLLFGKKRCLWQFSAGGGVVIVLSMPQPILRCVKDVSEERCVHSLYGCHAISLLILLCTTLSPEASCSSAEMRSQV